MLVELGAWNTGTRQDALAGAMRAHGCPKASASGRSISQNVRRERRRPLSASGPASAVGIFPKLTLYLEQTVVGLRPEMPVRAVSAGGLPRAVLGNVPESARRTPQEVPGSEPSCEPNRFA